MALLYGQYYIRLAKENLETSEYYFIKSFLLSLHIIKSTKNNNNTGIHPK